MPFTKHSSNVVSTSYQKTCMQHKAYRLSSFSQTPKNSGFLPNIFNQQDKSNKSCEIMKSPDQKRDQTFPKSKTWVEHFCNYSSCLLPRWYVTDSDDVVIDVEIVKIRCKIREINHGQLPGQRKKKLLLPPLINFLLQRANVDIVDTSLTILHKSIKNILVLISFLLRCHFLKSI